MTQSDGKHTSVVALTCNAQHVSHMPSTRVGCTMGDFCSTEETKYITLLYVIFIVLIMWYRHKAEISGGDV